MSARLSTRLTARFDDAADRTREALARQGFGVLTEVDVKARVQAQLGVEMEDYLIFGACDPAVTYRAINVDREIGLLLPCNVLVRADPGDPGSVIVEAMDPVLLVEVTGEPALISIAAEITEGLRAAIASLTESD
ncbi:ABC transporter [Mycobacterium sp. E3251]|uniref:DUF302 domain-containing protein n=1 Tax=unclassified Mycobacterium TaxID=2642494 RepID=UPI00080170A4|nr:MULTISPECIES: DUF302 domain-containing protein [unclassified Mycobacterium]OBG92810.1 ABC transporter [Mycobacterium sp. E3251]OBI26430.1 ABC transporter [Mycobacterium sp. E1386]OBI32962.1 ABC transporter [Mycobacterium sp. E2238]